MKKLIMSLVPIAAVAAIATAASPAPAAAPPCISGSTWCGWTDTSGNQVTHSDNAGDPFYWTGFGSGSANGNSHYCVNPSISAADAHNCSTAGSFGVAPIDPDPSEQWAGYVAPAKVGCSHNPDGSGNCPPSSIGGFYVEVENTGVGFKE
ncbi:MAG: hypothetical protein E6G56_13450 [Actinobacteria bacterium]|nr:MAG: hypothetical protein E6G56_13450 [Actinomycetota bacterium]